MQIADKIIESYTAVKAGLDKMRLDYFNKKAKRSRSESIKKRFSSYSSNKPPKEVEKDKKLMKVFKKQMTRRIKNSAKTSPQRQHRVRKDSVWGLNQQTNPFQQLKNNKKEGNRTSRRRKTRGSLKGDVKGMYSFTTSRTNFYSFSPALKRASIKTRFLMHCNNSVKKQKNGEKNGEESDTDREKAKNKRKNKPMPPKVSGGYNPFLGTSQEELEKINKESAQKRKKVVNSIIHGKLQYKEFMHMLHPPSKLVIIPNKEPLSNKKFLEELHKQEYMRLDARGSHMRDQNMFKKSYTTGPLVKKKKRKMGIIERIRRYKAAVVIQKFVRGALQARTLHTKKQERKERQLRAAKSGKKTSRRGARRDPLKSGLSHRCSQELSKTYESLLKEQQRLKRSRSRKGTLYNSRDSSNQGAAHDPSKQLTDIIEEHKVFGSDTIGNSSPKNLLKTVDNDSVEGGPILVTTSPEGARRRLLNPRGRRLNRRKQAGNVEQRFIMNMIKAKDLTGLKHSKRLKLTDKSFDFVYQGKTTPLITAVQNKDLAMIDFLIGKGVRVNLVDKHQKNALHYGFASDSKLVSHFS